MARPATSLFVLASKSGSTIEPNSMAAEAARRLRDAGVTEPGSRFIAITDADTALHKRALDERFREVFINPADIGGRYSAMSLFGLVPSALMGIDMTALLAAERTMADACRAADPRRNPGLALGAVMAAAALAGRDKLTLSLPARLDPFGLWVDSSSPGTGKLAGHRAVAGEQTSSLGDDRRVIPPPRRSASVASTGPHKRAHVPSVSLDMPNLAALGAGFFRQSPPPPPDCADINPFDEPNVQQAKDATRVLLDTYSAERRLPVPEPDAAIDRVRMTLTDAARPLTEGPLTFLELLRQSDYFGLLVYLPPEDEELATVLRELRDKVAAKTGCASMLGYGPCYLHSTGQLHKGGPNTGVFIILTADASPDLPIPGEPYSFGVLELAQALGDFESLNRTGRRALHLHLPRRDPALIRSLGDRLMRAR
jgi:hypothetical protein